MLFKPLGVDLAGKDFQCAQQIWPYKSQCFCLGWKIVHLFQFPLKLERVSQSQAGAPESVSFCVRTTECTELFSNGRSMQFLNSQGKLGPE